MSKKGKFKRFLVILLVLSFTGLLGYLSFVDVTPEPQEVTKEIDSSRFNKQ